MRSLRLSYNFSQPLAALKLPLTLTHLDIGPSFNHPLTPLAHTALQSLDMSGQWEWQQSMANVRFPPTPHTLIAPPLLLLHATLHILLSSTSVTHIDLRRCYFRTSSIRRTYASCSGRRSCALPFRIELENTADCCRVDAAGESHRVASARRQRFSTASDRFAAASAGAGGVALGRLAAAAPSSLACHTAQAAPGLSLDSGP
jgi:hypothetical protein